MQTTMRENFELIVTPSRRKMLRVGYSNLFLPMMLVFCVLAYKATGEFAMPPFLRWAITLSVAALFLVKYVVSIARIDLGEDRLRITCSLHEVVYEIGDVERIGTFAIPPSHYLVISIRLKTKILPRLFHFSAFSTNLGSFSQTRKALRDAFGTFGTKENSGNK